MTIQALAVSDEMDPRIYSASVRERLGHVDLVIGCGDLPARYLEFLADALTKPVYYVLGNHAEELTRKGQRGEIRHPLGCIDLGGTVVRDPATGLIMAGIPGSPRYCEGEPVQFSEREVLWMMVRMLPRLWWHRWRYGRALDVLVTHAPPRGIGDREDPAHRGFQAIRRFLKWFHPAYQLHGHIHLYDRSKSSETDWEGTKVINVYPFQVVELATPAPAPAAPVPEPVRAAMPAARRTVPVGNASPDLGSATER